MHYAENYAVGGSNRVNCMGGAIECRVSSLKKTDYFELKSTQQLRGRPFVHSDDSIVVLNVKEEARIGQKTAPAHCH
jgi:hypothetical protein